MDEEIWPSSPRSANLPRSNLPRSGLPRSGLPRSGSSVSGSPVISDLHSGLHYSGIKRIEWSSVNLSFALMPPSPCPYLPDLKERKLVTFLRPGERKTDALNRTGFRRSHMFAYRPSCFSCKRCKSVRVLCDSFRPNRSNRRLLRALSMSGSDPGDLLVTSCPTPAVATKEHFALFSSYVGVRHGDGEMALMSQGEFASMIEEAPVASFLMEWRRRPALPEPVCPGKEAVCPGKREGGQLVAACLVDVLQDGFSMLYSYFDPFFEIKGLGTFMILDLIRFCNEKKQPYLYLGYWVKNSPKMSYKARYRPLEVYDAEGWRLLEDGQPEEGRKP